MARRPRVRILALTFLLTAAVGLLAGTQIYDPNKRVIEAIAGGMRLAVCSTSNERSVNLIVEKLLGPERKNHFSAILAGDVVSRKKPDPEIYQLAEKRLGVNPAECFVVEDSVNGFRAVQSAGMHCIVTTNGYTEDEDFTGADLIVTELGDPPNVQVTLEQLKQLTDRTA